MLTISEEAAKLINKQVSSEIHNSLQYRAFGSWAENQGLKRLAAYFYKQSGDELGHAQRFTDYLAEANFQFSPPLIEAPLSTFIDCEAIANARIDLEGQTTDDIETIYAVAMRDNDVGLQDLLQALLREQVSEMQEALRLQSLVSLAHGNLIELDLSIGE